MIYHYKQSKLAPIKDNLISILDYNSNKKATKKIMKSWNIKYLISSLLEACVDVGESLKLRKIVKWLKPNSVITKFLVDLLM